MDPMRGISSGQAGGCSNINQARAVAHLREVNPNSIGA